LRFVYRDYFSKAEAELPFEKTQGKPHSRLVAMVFIAEMGLALVGLVTLVLPMTRVATIGAEALDGFAIAHIRVGDAAIAVVPIVGFGCGGTGGEEKAEGRSGQSSFSEKRSEIEVEKFHEIASRSLARAGDRGAS